MCNHNKKVISLEQWGLTKWRMYEYEVSCASCKRRVSADYGVNESDMLDNVGVSMSDLDKGLEGAVYPRPSKIMKKNHKKKGSLELQMSELLHDLLRVVAESGVPAKLKKQIAAEIKKRA